MTKPVWLVAVVGVALATSGNARAQRGATAQPRSAFRQELTFAAQLQDAVRVQDRQAVAELVRYPARVSVHLRPFPIYVEHRAALLQMYDVVFTPQMRCAIVASRKTSAGVPPPRYRLLLARGVVSLADSRVIAERSGKGMLITRLSSFGDTATRTGKPRQVTFDGPRREIQLGGRVAESGADAYVLAVKPRDLVEARIDGFPDRTLALRVTYMRTDRPLAGYGQDQRSWRALVKEGGDYRVEVVRRASYCEPPTIPYVLTLTLKP
jgi:hypothetical protein